ncbi:hypothetical protein B0T10DRAFT_604969 [Thelonectria olida]|uniref:Uncharacterized protein n=1 Tax=Thelonectria olida TaxID=1576542 RepID=A0A9P8W8C4_9HYPO|nr:hypothetical protein B0T10DRAFT_604969 [Thelonectria olida]
MGLDPSSGAFGAGPGLDPPTPAHGHGPVGHNRYSSPSIEPPQMSDFRMPQSFAPIPEAAAPTPNPHLPSSYDTPYQQDYYLDILPPVGGGNADADEEDSPVSPSKKAGGYVKVTDLDATGRRQFAPPYPMSVQPMPPYPTSAQTVPELAPPVPNLSGPSPAFGGQNYITTSGQANTTTVQPILPAPAAPAPGLRHYDTDKPTCSLNIVCYRSGQEGCKLEQVQCTLKLKFDNHSAFQNTIAGNPNLVYTDVHFFREMRRLFNTKMSSPWRRYLSLKTLKGFRILSYTPTSRPTVVPFDGFILQEMMYAYRNPGRVSTSTDWIEWVFRLRRADRRHAVEFVEGWDSTRIGIAGIIPWVSSCLVAIAWTAAGGDPQTTFTVASFILTSSSIILALLAIVSSIESSGNNIM